MAAVTVAGVGVDCLVSSRFVGRTLMPTLKRSCAATPRPGHRPGGRAGARGVRVRQVARREAEACEARQRQRESRLIVCW